MVAPIIMYGAYLASVGLVAGFATGLGASRPRSSTSGSDKGKKLNEYEKKIASKVIRPDAIETTLSDIGGLDDVISSLHAFVIIPLRYPHIFRPSSNLTAPPKGVLLHGPPGCGKTTIAKVLAKESGVTFISVTASVLTNKSYGDTNKLIAEIFSFARKKQPSIIFIDEIDTIFHDRSTNDHEATAMVKAQFMNLWDSLLSGSDRILILGTTRRIQDIDEVFLRRMPTQILVPLPNVVQREKILSLRTERMSSSSLKELCRNAAMLPVREAVRRANGDTERLVRDRENCLDSRPLTIEDFFHPDVTQTIACPKCEHRIM